jgi:hypothetical protein
MALPVAAFQGFFVLSIINQNFISAIIQWQLEMR